MDFRALAEAYPRSGGDIKNAVLKAAQSATTEPGPDAAKLIHQRHFVQGMEEVIAGTTIMAQSLFENGGAPDPLGTMEGCRKGRRRCGASWPCSASGSTGWRRVNRVRCRSSTSARSAALEEVAKSAAASAAASAAQVRTAWLVAIGGVVLALAALVVALVR